MYQIRAYCILCTSVREPVLITWELYNLDIISLLSELYLIDNFNKKLFNLSRVRNYIDNDINILKM